MSADEFSHAPDRRRFLAMLGLVGMSSALSAPALAFAQGATPAKPDDKPPAATTPPTTPPANAPPANAPPTISDDAKALAAIVQRRYGKFLDPKQLEGVTTEIQNRLDGGRRLKDAKLANSDEPDATFRP